MDDDKILLLVAAVVVFYVFKDGLFKPQGYTDPQALENANTRTGITSYRTTAAFGGQPATYASVGNTTYKILDSDLQDTGFLARRQAVVAALPSFLQFDFLKNWVYS